MIKGQHWFVTYEIFGLRRSNADPSFRAVGATHICRLFVNKFYVVDRERLERAC